MNMHHITTDVLIMGGGSAGLWAAYRCSMRVLRALGYADDFCFYPVPMLREVPMSG